MSAEPVIRGCGGDIDGDYGTEPVHTPGDDNDDVECDMREACARVVRRTVKPNILVVGNTGSGKSSLIDSIFGTNCAKEPVPPRTHIKCHNLAGLPVSVYEVYVVNDGWAQYSISSLKEIFRSNLDPHHTEDTMHVIWYVISSSLSQLITVPDLPPHLKNLPVVCIISKADISSLQERTTLKPFIDNLHFPRLLGCYDAVLGMHLPMFNLFDCPHCGSDELFIQKRKMIATCGNCHQQTSLEATSLRDIVAKTHDVLPDDEDLAKREIRKFDSHFTTEQRTSHRLSELELLILLARLWNFVDSAEGIPQYLFHKFHDKLLVFLERERLCNRLHSLALGIIWNRCLRHHFVKVITKATTTGNYAGNRAEDCEECFAEFCEGTLLIAEQAISDLGLEKVLENEMPTTVIHAP
ncbi:hypothetical protein Pelo_15229 [Pelomyxa schiedti]|nr:hypothetical protein Pelo_15229 [Pelomyxa schiedti]